MASDEAVNFAGESTARSGPSQPHAAAVPPPESLREEQIANAVAFLTNPKARQSQSLQSNTNPCTAADVSGQ